MVIKDFAAAMENRDFVGLSKCFAERCRLFDFAPAEVGQENFHVYGRYGIEMFYHNRFVLKGYRVKDARVVDENTLNFYATYGGIVQNVVADITAWEDGLIRSMVIHLA